MKIKISSDKLKAYLIVELEGELKDKSIDEILNFIRSNGVACRIKIAKIENLVKNQVEGEILIAEGNPPVDGRDAYISFAFDMGEKNLIRNVKSGERIAMIYPPTSGVDGIAVTCEVLKARSGKPIQNVSFGDSDDFVIVTTADGNLSLTGEDVIELFPILKVSNVDVNFGEVNFIKTLIVAVDIKSGVGIKVEKIFKNIKDVDVEVKENALIEGEFIKLWERKTLCARRCFYVI